MRQSTFFVLVAFCPTMGDDDTSSRDTRQASLSAAIDYTIRLVEEERYEQFIDRAIRPAHRREIVEEGKTKRVISALRAQRREVIAILMHVRQMEPELRTRLGFEAAIFKFEDDSFKLDGKSLKSVQFIREDGLWYFSLR